MVAARWPPVEDRGTVGFAFPSPNMRTMSAAGAPFFSTSLSHFVAASLKQHGKPLIEPTTPHFNIYPRADYGVARIRAARRQSAVRSCS